MSTVRKPNHLLRYEREKRGLSQRKLADLLDTSEDMISRWERGERKTSPYYQEKLCALFGKDAIALGFLDPPAFPLPDEAPQAIQKVVISEEDGENSAAAHERETFLPSTAGSQSHALDLLLTEPDRSFEQQAGAWLALGANSLGQLLNEGWTVESVFNALAVILHGVQAIPAIARSQLAWPDALAMPGHIHVPVSRHISVEKREQVTRALGESIATAWNLFNTSSIPQSLATGQALLSLAQQAHGLVYPDVLPLFYSLIHLLIGAALFFQARYTEALQAYERSYLTALQINDARMMAKSLIWKSNVQKACGRFDESVRLLEAAFRLFKHNEAMYRPTEQARLLATWAESAALIHEPDIAAEKLEAAAGLLDILGPDDEFDISILYYYRGVCAFYLDDCQKADTYFQQALQEHRPDWLLQRACTALLQAKARLEMGKRDASLLSARSSLPLIVALDAPLITWGFVDYIQELSARFPDSQEVAVLIKEARQHLNLPAQRVVPRYFEAKLA